jgi:hypothetical protein
VSGVTGSLLWGTALSGNTLDDGAGNTTTLSADPTQLRTPSLSIGHNLDGFLRQTSGARIEWSLEGNGGEPLVFAMNARGRPAGKSAALTLSTSGLNAIRSPRLFGAFCGVGYLGQFYRFPVKSVKVSPNNKLVNRLDANQSGGLLSVQIADREPTIIVEFDQVGMAFDWISRRDNEENISFGCMLGGDGTGTYAGRTTSPSVARTMIIAAPNCQVAECPDGDQDGYATVQVTLKPRYLRDAGDDDLVLALI